MKLRIAWFTPFNKASAIGKFSQIVTNELSKKHKVDIWVPENRELLETKLNIISYKNFKNRINKYLTQYDICIYNMGDHLYNHKDIYETSINKRGVIILHDLVMHHFFTGYYFLVLKDKEKYTLDILKFYGKSAYKLAKNSVNNGINPIWEDDLKVVEYPLFEKAIDGSYGTVTHSNFIFDRVKKDYSNMLTKINLPFVATKSLYKNKQKKDEIILITTLGNVNPNKRIDKVVEAIAINPNLKKMVKYVVIGSLENIGYVKYVKELITKYNLSGTVELKGYLEEDKLHKYLSESDIVVNLRKPSMEGASWSVLEAMSYEKPVLVNDTGSFSELPDNSVIKIDLESKEVKRISEKLEALVLNPTLRKKIGKQARKIILTNFSPKGYCNRLEKFLFELMNNKPKFRLIDSASKVISEISNNDVHLNLDELVEEIDKVIKPSAIK